MPAVIVDTSVWVQYFRDPESTDGDEVERLIQTNEAVLVGIVYAELARGVREDRELRHLDDKLKGLPFLETDRVTWRRAGKLLFDLRRQGVTLALPDAVIAALALENGYQVYTLDEHFGRVPGLRLYESKVG